MLDSRTSRPDPIAAAFAETAQQLKLSPMELKIDAAVDNAINQAFERSGLLVIGECHGVRENVSLVYSLAKRYGAEGLAFEADPSLGDAVKPMLAGGRIDMSLLPPRNDGSVSAEYMALIRQMNEEGMLRKLIFFDPLAGRHEDPSGRDRTMADLLLHGLPPGSHRTIAVTGALHARTEPYTNGHWDKEPGKEVLVEPAGYHIQKALPHTGFLDIHYRNGQHFGLRLTEGQYRLGAHDLPEPVYPITGKQFSLSENGRIIAELENVTAATPPPGFLK